MDDAYFSLCLVYTCINTLWLTNTIEPLLHVLSEYRCVYDLEILILWIALICHSLKVYYLGQTKNNCVSGNGKHIYFLIIFFSEKIYNFMHFERRNAFQNA